MKPCGEVEACDPLERSGDEHRDGGEQRVHHVQREGGEHEGELQRLGDTGEERGERTGEHQGSGGLLVLGLGVLVDRECTGRQAEHHDREEAGLVDAGDVHAERVEAAGGDDRATGRSALPQNLPMSLMLARLNQNTLFSAWCRPVGISRRLKKA